MSQQLHHPKALLFYELTGGALPAVLIYIAANLLLAKAEAIFLQIGTHLRQRLKNPAREMRGCDLQSPVGINIKKGRDIFNDLTTPILWPVESKKWPLKQLGSSYRGHTAD